LSVIDLRSSLVRGQRSWAGFAAAAQDRSCWPSASLSFPFGLLLCWLEPAVSAGDAAEHEYPLPFLVAEVSPLCGGSLAGWGGPVE